MSTPKKPPQIDSTSHIVRFSLLNAQPASDYTNTCVIMIATDVATGMYLMEIMAHTIDPNP